MAKTITNPFTPVVGKVPPHIAGREEIIADVEAALAGTGTIRQLSAFWSALAARAKRPCCPTSPILQNHLVGLRLA